LFIGKKESTVEAYFRQLLCTIQPRSAVLVRFSNRKALFTTAVMLVLQTLLCLEATAADQAKAENTGLARQLLQHGRLYLKLGQPGLARAVLTHGKKFGRFRTEYLSALADAYRLENDYVRARVAYNELAELIRGRLARVLEQVSETHAAEGNAPAAFRQIRQAVLLAPGDHKLLAQAASLAEQSKDAKSAIQYYERAFALAPENRAILLSLARLYGRTGKPAEAFRFYGRFIDATRRIAPGDPELAAVEREIVALQSSIP
jgi:tetratricopeptide (TPR) repeat protein